MSTPIPSTPILSLSQARALEAQAFDGRPERVEAAVEAVGRGLARELLADFCEYRRDAAPLRLLLLVGPGHNGADALATALAMQERLASVLLWQAEAGQPRPLREQKLQELKGQLGPGRLSIQGISEATPVEALMAQLDTWAGNIMIDLCLDGLLGLSASGPLSPVFTKIINTVNAYKRIAVRATVDLPSGIGQRPCFRADFTYATGSVKEPLFAAEALPHVGRIRFVPIEGMAAPQAQPPYLLTPEALAPLQALRSAGTDKRSLGHLVIVAGCSRYAGAAFMTARAALHSGVGLVSACVPAHLVPSFAAALPEVLWTPMPITPEGYLASSGTSIIQSQLKRASALLIGPGMGSFPSVHALAAYCAQNAAVPCVFDADTLQAELFEALAQGPKARAVILTPHAGEYARLQASPWAQQAPCIWVKKGPHTEIYDKEQHFFNCLGGPVLSRGGSGDLLAGIIAGLLAQTPQDPLQAAALGTLWHGQAADRLAQAQGQRVVRIGKLLDYL